MGNLTFILPTPRIRHMLERKSCLTQGKARRESDLTKGIACLLALIETERFVAPTDTHRWSPEWRLMRRPSESE